MTRSMTAPARDTTEFTIADSSKLTDAGCESVVDYVLLKMAARCNIACTYCYWFRDPSVYDKPKVITRETLDVLSSRLREHIVSYKLGCFSILFHGGEPLLCKEADFDAFCADLKRIELDTQCTFKLNVTTNGLLIDDHWIALFKKYSIGVTLSIDGPQEVHDAARVDFKGNGTFDRVIAAIESLRQNGIEPGILTVCNPEHPPSELFQLLVDQLGFHGFDVLIPDATHLDSPKPIYKYYQELFDLWLDEYDSRGVRVRIIDNILLGLFGGYSESESIGYGPIRRLTVLTDGSMETLDVLRIIDSGFTASNLNIHRNSLQEIESDPLWREVLHSSLNLSKECNACVYNTSCGGGHIATRWDKQNRFDNPSVYCRDIKSIFEHVWGRIKPELRLVPVVPAE